MGDGNWPPHLPGQAQHLRGRVLQGPQSVALLLLRHLWFLGGGQVRASQKAMPPESKAYAVVFRLITEPQKYWGGNSQADFISATVSGNTKLTFCFGCHGALKWRQMKIREPASECCGSKFLSLPLSCKRERQLSSRKSDESAPTRARLALYHHLLTWHVYTRHCLHMLVCWYLLCVGSCLAMESENVQTGF